MQSLPTSQNTYCHTFSSNQYLFACSKFRHLSFTISLLSLKSSIFSFFKYLSLPALFPYTFYYTSPLLSYYLPFVNLFPYLLFLFPVFYPFPLPPWPLYPSHSCYNTSHAFYHIHPTIRILLSPSNITLLFLLLFPFLFFSHLS